MMEVDCSEGSQTTTERKQSFGIKSILERHRSNSKILTISNWFSQNTWHYDSLIPDEIRYFGNSSDLWSLLAFEIKAITPLLNRHAIDINLIKRQLELGQLFLLFKAQSKIQNLKIRLELHSLYLEKLNRMRMQVLKERTTLQHSEALEHNWLWLLTQHFQDDNQAHTITCFNTLLTTIINVVDTKEEQQPNLKTRQVITLICISLLFVLANPRWDAGCLPQALFADCFIKHLIQPNGTMIIAKYLHDARPAVLSVQIAKFQHGLYTP